MQIPRIFHVYSLRIFHRLLRQKVGHSCRCKNDTPTTHLGGRTSAQLTLRVVKRTSHALSAPAFSIHIPYIFHTYYTHTHTHPGYASIRCILHTFHSGSMHLARTHIPYICHTYSMHTPYVSHPYFMHVPCIIHAYYIHAPYIFHTYSMRIPYILKHIRCIPSVDPLQAASSVFLENPSSGIFLSDGLQYPVARKALK